MTWKDTCEWFWRIVRVISWFAPPAKEPTKVQDAPETEPPQAEPSPQPPQEAAQAPSAGRTKKRPKMTRAQRRRRGRSEG